MLIVEQVSQFYWFNYSHQRIYPYIYLTKFESISLMRNLISSTVLSLFSLTAFAQGPAQMAYGLGVTYFMADKGSSFGSWGSNEGGYDGFNLEL